MASPASLELSVTILVGVHIFCLIYLYVFDEAYQRMAWQVSESQDAFLGIYDWLVD